MNKDLKSFKLKQPKLANSLLTDGDSFFERITVVKIDGDVHLTKYGHFRASTCGGGYNGCSGSSKKHKNVPEIMCQYCYSISTLETPPTTCEVCGLLIYDHSDVRALCKGCNFLYIKSTKRK